jgi:hypothetical protein
MPEKQYHPSQEKAKDIDAKIRENLRQIRANRHPDAILAYVRSGSSLGGESRVPAKWWKS